MVHIDKVTQANINVFEVTSGPSASLRISNISGPTAVIEAAAKIIKRRTTSISYRHQWRK